MRYLLVTYRWRILTRPQVAPFKCPVTLRGLKTSCGDLTNASELRVGQGSGQ